MFALDVNNNIKTFNLMIELYNSQMDIGEDLLSSSELCLIAWPAAEFSTVSSAKNLVPPIDWNSSHTLSNIKDLMQHCRLPYLAQLELKEDALGHITIGQKTKLIRATYEAYVALLATKFKSDESKSSLLSTIWRRMAPWERSNTHQFSQIQLQATKFNQTRFPFSSIALIVCSFAIDHMEILLKDIFDTKGYGWYNYDYLHQHGFSQLNRSIEKIINDWKTQTVDTWTERGAGKVADTAISQPRSLKGYNADITPPPSAVPSISSAEPNTLYMQTPIQKKHSYPDSRQQQQQTLHYIPNSVFSTDSKETEYSNLKRRLADMIAVTKKEVETRKRRLNEHDK